MTARERRTVRWGAVATAAILAYVLVLDPWLVARSQRRDAIAAAEAGLARLVALERSLPELRERLAQARAVWTEEVEPRLLPAQAPAVAASTLSEEVRRLAAASLLEVEREDPLPAREDGGLTAVPVQFSLRGDVYGLRDFLGTLETAETFLHLRELRVNSTGNAFGPALPGAPLQVTVTLEGYLGDEEPALPPDDVLPEPAAGGGVAPPPVFPPAGDPPAAGTGLAPGAAAPAAPGDVGRTAPPLPPGVAPDDPRLGGAAPQAPRVAPGFPTPAGAARDEVPD